MLAAGWLVESTACFSGPLLPAIGADIGPRITCESTEQCRWFPVKCLRDWKDSLRWLRVCPGTGVLVTFVAAFVATFVELAQKQISTKVSTKAGDKVELGTGFNYQLVVVLNLQ